MITILKHGGRAQKLLQSDLNSIALTIRHILEPHWMYSGVIYVMVCGGSTSLETTSVSLNLTACYHPLLQKQDIVLEDLRIQIRLTNIFTVSLYSWWKPALFPQTHRLTRSPLCFGFYFRGHGSFCSWTSDVWTYVRNRAKYETFLIIHLLYFSTEIKRFIKSIRRQASRSLYIKNISIASWKQKSIL